MSDAQERTEQATTKHMKEVRSKGRMQKSRDLTAWVAVAVGAVMVPVTFSKIEASLQAQVLGFQAVIADPTNEAAISALQSGLASVGNAVWPMLVVVAMTIIVTTAAQGGIHPRRFELRFQQFNIVKGIGNMFGARTGWEAIKTLAKATVVGIGFYMVIQSLIPDVAQSGGFTVQSLLNTAQGGVWSLMRLAIGGGLLFSGLDVFVTIRRNRKTSRMTKREVKDENKNTEGDPMVRAHRRSRQLAMSRSRMMSAVADADVVLVNPTHVAVALTYEAGKSAPRVVAKGADNIATRIREEAVEQGVPMVQDIPLARSLYKQCQIGQEIPVEHFNAVAHVLAFVMALKKRGSALNDVFTVPAPPNPNSR